jgi:L-arabinose transport system substrate-binding protein
MQSPRTPRRTATALAITGILALAVTLTACGTTDAPSSGGKASKNGPIRIAYIQKQGDQQYFVDEAKGASDAAKAAGAEVTAINVGSDANAAISQMETVISQGYDAIAIVVPDQKIGPQIIDMAKKAGIPLVATDDTISDGSSKAAPFVGFDGRSMGEKVGAEAAALFKKESGWTPADTKFLSVSKQDLQTCEDRVDGAYDVFTKDAGVTLDRVKVGSDASNVDSQDKAAAAITGNPGVKHWVVVGCNDESETGAVTALQNAGLKPADIIGVGLGAYLTCKDWKAGTETGNKAALYISGVDVGKAAVNVLVDKVKNGVALPANTIADTKIVDPTSWQAAGVACT